MTTTPTTLPDFTTQTATAYKTAIDSVAAMQNRLAGAFAPHAQDTPNMTVRVDAGWIGGAAVVPTEVAAQNTATITAPAANPRKDIVYVDAATGAVGVATGAEAGSPVDPAVPAGKLAVARIALVVAQTEITNADLDDLRTVALTVNFASDSDVAAGTATDSAVTPAGGASAYVRKAATATLTAGYSATAANLGTLSSGTTTLAFADGNMQRAVNGGAFTLAPPSAGDGTIVLQLTNNASAGAVTTSGWTKVSGTLTTTNGDDFLLYCTRCNGFTRLTVDPMQ